MVSTWPNGMNPMGTATEARTERSSCFPVSDYQKEEDAPVAHVQGRQSRIAASTGMAK